MNNKFYRFYARTSCRVVEEPCDRDSDWARPDTDTEWTVNGIYQNKSGDLITDMDLQVGDTAFLVYVVSSSGDSFGRDRGKYLTPIHLFDNMEKAERAVREIYAHNAANDPNGPNQVSNTVIYTGNDGCPNSEYACWIGYFDSLDCVNIEEVTVIDPPAVRPHHQNWGKE